MDRRVFLFASLSVGACATTPGLRVAAAREPRMELEPLYGLRSTRKGLEMSVHVDGCTPVEDYVPYIDRLSRPATLSVARRRLRACPAGAGLGYRTLIFSWAQLGLGRGEPLLVLNPLRVAP
jgi:hypothetical protein